MHSASELTHDGVDRLTWREECMSPFCLPLESVLRGLTCVTGVVNAEAVCP